MSRGIQKALGYVGGKAEQMASYDDNDGVYYDENTGNYVKAQGLVGRARPNVVVVKSHQNPARTQDKAQFDINITRLTNNILQPLPVGIFGSTHARSGYQGIIIPPPATTLVVVGGLNSPVAGTSDRLRFTYTSGANIDSIDITCNQVPYPVFLAALEADIFRISNIRYQLINSANTIQFSQAFKFQSKSLFGKDVSNDVSIGAYKKPEQFQPGIIDIPISADIDKETLINANISESAIAYPFSITMSVFVEKFNKHDKLSA
jgi:hypothetical protein